MRLLVECEEGNLIGGRRFSQHCLRFGQHERPKVLTPHAGAGIHQQDDLVADAGFLIGNHGLLKKRPGKTQRQETEHQATQQQQENIFQPITARHSRRSRLEKHQRAKGHPLLARAANEVKDDGQRDSNGAEQKEWRQEAHGFSSGSGVQRLASRAGVRNPTADSEGRTANIQQRTLNTAQPDSR